jgi:hypothetical protein
MDPIFVTSLQKTGTNLVKQPFGEWVTWIGYIDGLSYADMMDDIIKVRPQNLMPREEALEKFDGFLTDVWISHLPWDQELYDIMEENGVRYVFNIRDPRDMAVSQMFSCMNNPNTRANFTYKDGTILTEKEDMLLWIIKSLRPRWEAFMPWLEHADFVMRYEHLRTRPVGTLGMMYRALDIPGHKHQLGLPNDAAARIIPANSPTFRKGGIGEWKEYFKEEHLYLYNDTMGDIHKELGYAR